MTKERFIYFVEGETEKLLVNTLKSEMKLIESGSVKKFNVIQDLIKNSNLIDIKPGSIVILIFDTDVQKTDILLKNINILNKSSIIKDVICIPQVLNFEDELIRSCSIKKIIELTSSKSVKDFKRDFCKFTPIRLKSTLEKRKFDIDLLWNQNPKGDFKTIENKSKKIKK